MIHLRLAKWLISSHLIRSKEQSLNFYKTIDAQSTSAFWLPSVSRGIFCLWASRLSHSAGKPYQKSCQIRWNCVFFVSVFLYIPVQQWSRAEPFLISLQLYLVLSTQARWFLFLPTADHLQDSSKVFHGKIPSPFLQYYHHVLAGKN